MTDRRNGTGFDDVEAVARAAVLVGEMTLYVAACDEETLATLLSASRTRGLPSRHRDQL